jgi:hypothetical protein
MSASMARLAAQRAARDRTSVAPSVPSVASVSGGIDGGGVAGGGTGKLTFVAGAGQLTRLVFVAEGGLCCGLVGSKGKFCVEAVGMCTVSSHSKKAVVNTSHYYVLDPSRNDPVAFLEPSLPYDRTDETFRSLLDAKDGARSVMAWRTMFSVRLADILRSSEELLPVERIALESVYSQTPIKRMKPRLENDVLTEDDFLSKNTLSPVKEEDVDGVQASLAYLTANFETLKVKVPLISATLSELWENVAEGRDLLQGKLAALHVSIGSKPSTEVASLSTGGSVWEGLVGVEQYVEEVVSSVADDFKGISRDLSVVVADVDLLQIDTANNLDMMKGLDECVESLLVDWPSFQEFYTRLTGTAAGAEPAAALELRLSTLEASASRRRPTLGISGERMSVEMASDLRHMMSRIDSLEARLSTPGGEPEEQVPSSSALDELSRTVLLLRQELSAQRVATDILERRETHRSVTVVGMPFRDLQDCVAFAVSSVPLQFYGYFFDMMSLFSRFAELNRDTANSLAVQHAVAKASYGSEDAALISLSFGIVIPVVFGKHSSVLQPLPSIVKFEDWAGVGGKREQLEIALELQLSSLTSSIELQFGQNTCTKAHSLARGLLTAAARHVSSLITFLDRQYEAMTSMCKDEKQAWLCACDLVKTVFTEVHKARYVALRDDQKNSPVYCGQVLWGILQGYRRTEIFMSNQFKNDPALMACLTQHQFKQSVSAKDIATLTADVKAVKSSTEEQKKAVAKVVGRVDVLERGR